MVVLEGDRAAVVDPAVGLHDEALRAPEEVDLPAPELDVDLGWWDAVMSAECQEEGLQVTARAVGLDAFEAVALELGPADGAAEEARWD